jgi:hypothetical protein
MLKTDILLINLNEREKAHIHIHAMSADKQESLCGYRRPQLAYAR